MASVHVVFQFLLIATAANFWHGQVQGRVITSTNKFSQFASLDLAAGLNRYLQHETKRLEIIKSSKGYEKELPILKTRLKKLQLLNKQMTARKAELDSLRKKLSDFHPTSALRAVSDFLETWGEKLQNDTVYGFRFAEFLSNDDRSKLPTKSDLLFLCQAVAEIQFVYNLTTSDLYAGKVIGQKGTPLLPKDAYEIAHASRDLSHLEQAAWWFEIALNNTPEAEMKSKNVGNTSYPFADAMAYLGALKYGMDEQQKGLKLLERASDLDPENDRILREYLRHRHGRDVQPLVHSDPGEFKMHWFRLCANASSTPLAPVKWYHVCRYRTSFRVPYKVYREEILSRSPFLSLIHDLVTPQEARRLINVSKDKIGHPAVEGAESHLFNVQGTQLKNNETIAATIADRIADLTGMDTTERKILSSGEPLHVLNYGISGSFQPHQDIYRPYGFSYMMNLSGHRLASVLIYLSNVKAGGATAFPHLNISVTPELGKALLWFNTSPNGEVEKDIVHAGCPVAVGAKWVASKGIWSSGNELRRPCGPKVTSSHLAVDKIAPRIPASP
ncbi:prolyl 4-hydroxylase subunit alpha-1-like [Littorina saxatilis]|uniref:procollagen-proline 4-dioxygenase n=1 Tax=Littorina saxatilis TaxID=31220 RepID=A0AAN9FX48_9CAEN